MAEWGAELMADGEYDGMPNLLGVELHRLVASMQQLSPEGSDGGQVAALLTDYERDFMPFWTSTGHLSHGPALYCLVRLVKPLFVIETGVREGESTISVLAAMCRNGLGQLFSCDIDLPMERTFRFLSSELGKKVRTSLRLNADHDEFLAPKYRESSVVPAGIACPEWSFEQCTGVDLLRRVLDPHGSFVNRVPRMGIDMFFHDSDHGYANQKAEYDLAWDLVRPGGWVGGDDVEWDKQPWAFYEFCERVGIKPSYCGKGRMIRKPGA